MARPYGYNDALRAMALPTGLMSSTIVFTRSDRDPAQAQSTVTMLSSFPLPMSKT